MALALRDGEKGRRRSRRAQHKPMSEINVTPFVDVLLVLLVIFIVAAPLLTVGVPINLPETAAKPLVADQEEPLTISVSADGRVSLQKTEVRKEELIQRLRAIMAERRSTKIYVKGDRDAKYETVMQIMGALNNAGFRDIGLVTDGGGPTFDGGRT